MEDRQNRKEYNIYEEVDPKGNKLLNNFNTKSYYKKFFDTTKILKEDNNGKFY